MFQPGLFDGQIILVTGGGSGIGFAIAREFLKLGGRVFIASRKQARIDEAVARLSAFGAVSGFVLDIRKPEDAEAAADHIAQVAGQLDILINNAGGQFPIAAEHLSINGWNAVVNNNLNGSWYMTHTMARRFFIPQKGGVINTIIAGVSRGFPGMVHTGAARARFENFTKSLAVESAPHHIRINAVAPGYIHSSGMEQYPPELKANINAAIPMRRLGTTTEVAWLTVFLSSPMAAYITGQSVYIDGGQGLWGSLWQVPLFEPAPAPAPFE